MKVEIFKLTAKQSLLAIVILLSISSCNGKRGERMLINNAQLNLQEWDFNENNVQFGGVSAFYWNELLTLEKIESRSKDSSLISITSSWNNQKDPNCNFPIKGFASYYFKIGLPEELVGKQFILRPNHFIAYASQIYVNNKMVSHNGYVGKCSSDSSYKPNRNASCSSFIADSSSLNVVIWVSNYSHFRGGIFNDFLFGFTDNMIKQRERAVFFNLLVIISLLIMFLYQFLLFFVNTKDIAALFFGITCLIYALDFSFQDTMTFFLFFPNAGFTLTSLLHLSLPYLIPSSFIFFLYALFPEEVSIRIRNIIGAITLVLVSITMLNIPDVYMNLAKPHFAYNFLVVLYIYFVVIKAVIRKREGSVLFLMGYLVLSVCAINDILFVFEIIHTSNLISSGLMVFVLFTSILQGRRMARMRNNNLQLTNKLQKLNTGLEKKVAKRTEELSITNIKLQKLISFKEDMTNTIIHDLKTPLNAIVNAKLITDEGSRLSMVQHAGYTMLNLIKNILDVYRYDNTTINLNKKRIELINVIRAACQEIMFSATQKKLTLKIGEELNCNINIDEEFIHRVFVNILSNAVKHSPNNGVIEIKIQPESENTVKISVCNAGAGISVADQKRIFKKFGQTTDKSTEGHSSGIGLAFCKMAIEAHGGKIGVVSKTDVGVEFWFTLPDSYCVEGKNYELKESNSNMFMLRQLDKKYLLPFLLELKRYELFEVSAIKSVLKRVEKRNQAIEYWMSEIENAVFVGDIKTYKKLLDF